MASREGDGPRALPGFSCSNPNALWVESAVYYATVMALSSPPPDTCFHRAVSQVRPTAGSSSCASLAGILPLTRAFFTWLWCFVAVGFAAVLFWRTRKGPAVLAAALLPCVLVAAFQLKQWWLFGLTSGSSWLGCNLTTMTAGMSREKEEALGRGKVSPLVKVYRNASPEVVQAVRLRPRHRDPDPR